MSTLKVDTIQPNASDRLFVSSTLEVDGSQLLVNNALNVGGNASITGSLSAATLTSNGTIAANGNVTGVSNLSCSSVTAAGAISGASLSISGSASVNTLTIGGSAYDQRVVKHVRVSGNFTYTEVAATASFPAYNRFNDDPGVSLTNNIGFSGSSWLGSGTNFQLRLNFSGNLSSSYLVSVNCFASGGLSNLPFHPYFSFATGYVQLNGYFLPQTNAVVKYYDVFIIG